MLDNSSISAPIVFLHIPKTAGQTVHNELVRAVGKDGVSPIRVHSQANSAAAQFPDGYKLYSGHIDWEAIDRIDKPRFVFSILRDPRERIASFYFYLLKEAKKLNDVELTNPQNLGKRTVLELSTDDYFFGGSDAWKSFVQDHYDNFYCRYFGSRKIRAGQNYASLPDRRKLRTAMRNVEKIDWIYSIENLAALEDDLNELYGYDLNLTTTRSNVGDQPVTNLRWPRLLETLEHDKSRALLENLVTLDFALMERLEL